MKRQLLFFLFLKKITLIVQQIPLESFVTFLVVFESKNVEEKREYFLLQYILVHLSHLLAVRSTLVRDEFLPIKTQ